MDVICFSHLRWNFVYQRPQHLLSRFSNNRVFFIEEPVFDSLQDYYECRKDAEGTVSVVVPHVRPGLSSTDLTKTQKELVDSLLRDHAITSYIAWYYSPMSLQFSDHLSPALTVFDCMDELSAFKFAPPELTAMESQLMKKADLVFTGGYSLFEAKKNRHDAIYSFPSSIDKHHFALARNISADPVDQKDILHPRLGFYGVIDERLDIQLLQDLAAMRPAWHFILIGPVVKIDPASLPRNNNIHYLGSKQYKDLPHYLGGWDIAIMPFALNESTRFISPTKTPEYLAGGKPVISTPIRDVINPYGDEGLVHIAGSAEEFVTAAEFILGNTRKDEWLANVDAYLANISWDKTWQQMVALIDQKIMEKKILKLKKVDAYV